MSVSKVECKICGKMYISVFPFHLKSHGLSLPEYRERFPGVSYQSEELAKRRSQSASRVNMGRILSDQTKRKIAESVLASPKKLCGDKHPKWVGGIRVSSGFALSKRKLLAIKGEKCEGIDCRGNSRYFVIHHRDEDYANNNLENLMILCTSCHRRIHGVAPTKEVRKMAEKARRESKYWLRLRRNEAGQFKRKFRRGHIPDQIEGADRVFEFIKDRDGVTKVLRR